MASDERLYYDKHNRLRIKAFVARIDKSKAFRGDSGFKPLNSITSPYFASSKQQQEKPLTCSLLDREAEAYGYKLASSTGGSGGTLKNVKRSTNYVQRHKRITKLLLFTPFMTAGLAAGSQTTKADSVMTQDSSCKKGLASSMSNSLRQKLDRNVLKATRIAMTHTCRQYPRLPSRNVLAKYAHLFGLDSSEQSNSNKLQFSTC